MAIAPLQGMRRPGRFCRAAILAGRSMFVWLQQQLKNLTAGRGRDVKELAARLGLPDLQIDRQRRRKVDAAKPDARIRISYRWQRIPKRGGGTRLLHSPNPQLKQVQRKLLRRVFARLKVHPAAKGFRRGESIATHARLHVGQAVVVRIDIHDFFPSTRGERVYKYFRQAGWNRHGARTIFWLCTKSIGRRVGLPQGSPTSPILSNLVNYGMDARLAGLARKSGARYSRYADDIIFSFAQDDRRFIRGVIRRVRRILGDSNYRMHGREKLRVMRRHQRQVVTGLVVNDRVQLPRKTRRWLRAVEHHLRTGRPATLTREQLRGWRALEYMILRQCENTAE